MRIFTAILIAFPLLGQTAFDTKTTVEKVAALVEEGYVYEDAAKRVAAYLRQQEADGAYASITDPAILAKTLTEDLRRVGDDQHFEVVVREGSQTLATPSTDWLTPLRKRNFDFARVECMAGNIGLIDLRSFPPPEVAGDTAAAAMALVANTDALIIDLRQNSGGTGDMALFLASYFFEQRTTIIRTFRRAENRTTEDRTLPYVPGHRVVKTPLYILTSAKTFSAAEAFAFGLQQLGRAKIVGEKTRGGANAGRYRRVDDVFSVFIPMAHAMAAESDKSWERTGIQPDIEVPADSALTAALEAIRASSK